MRINPNSPRSSTLKHLKRATDIMSNIDQKHRLVKRQDGESHDLVPGPEVGVVDLLTTFTDRGQTTLNVASTDGNKFSYEQTTWLQMGSHIDDQKVKASRVEGDDSIIYKHEQEGTHSKITLDKTTGEIDFTQEKRILGGLFSWNIVE